MGPDSKATLRKALGWTPMVWPIGLLAGGILLAPPVPIHWQWDAFQYVEAGYRGQLAVPMGWGRTPFCLMARLYADSSQPDPFVGFRRWVYDGILLNAVALAFGLAILRLKLGSPAAHAAGAVFTLSPSLLTTLWSVYPENWSIPLLVLGLGVLAIPGTGPVVRLVFGGLACFLMIAVKEISVYYVPALVLAGFACLPGAWSRRRRLVLACLVLMGSAIIALGLLHLLSFLSPEVADARADLGQHYWEQPGVGLSAFGRNTVVLGRTLAGSAGAPFLLMFSAWSVSRRRRDGRAARGVSIAVEVGLLLVLVPAASIAALSATYNVPRYSAALIPGLALLCSAGFANHPGQDSGATFSPPPALLCLGLAVVVLLGNDWQSLRRYYYLAERDSRRYGEWTQLRDQPLFIIAADDAWAAEFIRNHPPPGRPPSEWFIHWPGWTTGPEASIPWDVLDDHLEAGRALAVASSAAERAGMEVEEYLGGFEGMVFVPGPGGWWIGVRSPG